MMSSVQSSSSLSLILFYCVTISAAFAKRTLLQATSYRTITGTWYDNYQLAPPNNLGWEVKNANGNNVEILTANSYSSYSHGPFTGDFDFSSEKYYITQQFKCNVGSTVSIAYFVTFCNTDQSDYVRLYLNEELATTTTMSSGTGTEYSEPALATATKCSPWEYYYIDSNYIPYVSANTLWKVHFEIGVNWRSDFVAITGIALTCTPQPTPSPTPAPTTANPSQSPTRTPTFNPTPYPTPSPTINPTRSPTNNPTPYPTMQPTRSPTNIPTYNPSKMPTTSPSNLPTMSTNMPSKAPTNAPTFSPTRAEGSVGTESDGATTPLLDTSNESDAKGNDGKHSDLIKKILFMIIGFAVITCIVLWLFYCKMRSKKKKENAAFRLSQNIAGKRVIEMEQRDAGNGIGGAANKSKNKIRYSPFAGRTSPKKVQNKSLHQHIIQSESNELEFGVQAHQLSGLDSFMLDAVHDNDVDAIDDGTFSGGNVNIVISPGNFSGDGNHGLTITPLPNSLMFAAGNSNMANDIILDEDDDDMMIMHDITAQ